MARGAIGAPFDLVGLDELGADGHLVAGLLPVHGEDLFPRSHLPLGVAVTVETPFHVQAGMLPHQGHLVNWPVAARATDSLLDVNAVIEVDELGQVVYALPAQRAIRLEAGSA